MQAAACGHQGCTAVLDETWWTWPNLVTAVRTLGTVVLWALAVAQDSAPLLLAALACYWLGDVADGILARVTGSETRTGGALDILSDRLSICLVAATYVGEHPAAALPAGVFLLQFVVVDGFLSLSFRNWSLLSVNYFALVDRTVFRLNWSRPAKMTNTMAVAVVVVLTGWMALATLLATAVLAVKIYSAVLLARRPVPRVLSGCAVLDASPPASRDRLDSQWTGSAPSA